MKALVVVDMQTAFLERMGDVEASEEVVARVVARIRAAKRLKRAIIVLKYELYGPNDPRINKALKGYKKQVTIWKSQDDGGPAIHQYITGERKRLREFQLVGINLGFCVLSTCYGLRHYNYCAWIDTAGCNREGGGRISARSTKKNHRRTAA